MIAITCVSVTAGAHNYALLVAVMVSLFALIGDPQSHWQAQEKKIGITDDEF